MDALLTVCAWCGCAFRTTRGNRFCSKTCACRWLNDQTRLAPRVCAHCGKLFQPKRGPRVFCSRRCAAAVGTERASALAAEQRKAPAESGRFVKKCQKCGQRFTTAQVSRVLCRPSCPGRRLCPNCGRPVTKRGTIFCSQSCAAQNAAEKTTYCPSPKKIAEICASIRLRWPPGEAEKRIRPDWLRVEWTPPSSTPAPLHLEAIP